MKKLVRILPFMENEEIKELANEIINGEVEGVKLVMLFPFLRNTDLDEIVDLLLEKKDSKSLRHAIPFARKTTVDKIYKAVQNGEIEGIKESYFYPFLGKDELKSMFKVFIKEAKEEAKEAKGKTKREFHVHLDSDDEINVDIDMDHFDIDLEDETTEVNDEVDTLKREMKVLKQKLKEYKEQVKKEK